MTHISNGQQENQLRYLEKKHKSDDQVVMNTVNERREGTNEKSKHDFRRE